jgi:hypothetical protein
MLEPIRQYAFEKLNLSGDAQEARGTPPSSSRWPNPSCPDRGRARGRDG